jgi:molecular chaperone HscB
MMTSPFEVLGVPAQFALDEHELEKRHRELSRALHPDRYARRPGSERRQALSRAVSVNEAFRKLRDPLSRAEALLEALGDASAEGHEPKPSPALLLGIMEQREALAAAREARDRARIEALLASAGKRVDELLDALADAFIEQPVDSTRVRQLLSELRYLRRLQEEAGALVDDL